MLIPKIIACPAIKVITKDNKEILIAIPDKTTLTELKIALDTYYPNYKKVFLEETVGILNFYHND